MIKFIIPSLALIAVALCAFTCNSSNTIDASNKTLLNTMSDSTHHQYYSRTDTTKLVLPDSTWKAILDPDVYEIARHAATERAFTGEYWNYEGIGDYYCRACGNHLFVSDAKFASSCGWPSFFETIRPNSAIYKVDKSHGMYRTEVLCGRCEGHLGHIFDDGPAPTGKRFCMNSIVLEFAPRP